MTFEEWWETAPMADSRFGLAWEAWQAATAAEREQCAREAYEVIVTLSSRELAQDVAAFIRKEA